MRKEDEEEDYLDDSESREYLSAGNEGKTRVCFQVNKVTENVFI